MILFSKRRHAVFLVAGICLLFMGFSSLHEAKTAAGHIQAGSDSLPDPLHPDYKKFPLQEWEKKFAGFTFHVFKQAGNTLPYRFYKPANKAAKKLPLVIFMHGAGERGADNRKQFMRFDPAPFWQTQACYVLAPQCPELSATGKGDDNVWVQTPFEARYHTIKSKPTWPLQLTMALIDSIVASGSVDAGRVYVTGLSMGGFASWELLKRRPGLFAAAMPVCGGGDTTTAAAIRNVPLWVFHGDADEIVPVDCSRDMIRALRNTGGKPLYTELPSVRHNAWEFVYPRTDAWKWLFSYSRK